MPQFDVYPNLTNIDGFPHKIIKHEFYKKIINLPTGIHSDISYFIIKDSIDINTVSGPMKYISIELPLYAEDCRNDESIIVQFHVGDSLFYFWNDTYWSVAVWGNGLPVTNIIWNIEKSDQVNHNPYHGYTFANQIGSKIVVYPTDNCSQVNS